MSRVITFGEIMMRLNPKGYLRFVQAEKFEATYAGGEANVAVSLANYGMDAAFVSKVPAHEIGQCAVNELRRYGVDTSLVLRGGTRLGVYYCEKGASQRASKVIYDRAGSAIAAASAKAVSYTHLTLPTTAGLHGRLQSGQGKGPDDFLRSQLPQKALDARAGR